MFRHIALTAVYACLPACANSTRDRPWLDGELLQRTGADTCTTKGLPPAVDLKDGLDESEVVSLVLWRNPAIRAELARIDAAQATLAEANRPANPQLSMMGPFGPITAVASLLLPIEFIWQAPYRTKAAAREADVTGESVLMRALDLVRDARLLHTELGLASDRALVRNELAKVALEASRIASVRANVGDISPMEERVIRADAKTSADASELAQTEMLMARARLLPVVAIDEDAAGPVLATFLTDVTHVPNVHTLLGFARAARPDVRAAELAIAAVTARAGWERSRIVNLSAAVETQWHQPAGPGLRLGGRGELPVFNWNQGGIGRADSEVQRAAAQHDLVARSVTMEVTLAHARFEQAVRSRRRFDAEILPPLDEALQMATRGFEEGDQSYLVVLDVLRRVGEARLRRAELVAEQRRGLCELERAMGARLASAAKVASRALADQDAK